jgi:hypothetical protein
MRIIILSLLDKESFFNMKFPNRYDFMIDIEMREESLKLFDNSKIHHIWKEKDSHYLEDKIIFDY